MKVPSFVETEAGRQVLKYLPIWQFECPICGEFLGYEAVHKCVKCGALFTPEKARPPFLYPFTFETDEFSEWTSTDGSTVRECENCFKIKPCRFLSNPYLSEIEGIELEEWLCEECLDSLAGDV